MLAQQLHVRVHTSDNQPAFFGEALLVSRDHDTIKLSGNLEGEFLFTNLSVGIYKLFIRDIEGSHDLPARMVRLRYNDTLEIELTALPCSLDYPLQPCPVSKSMKRVILVDYTQTTDQKFQDEEALEKYTRSLQRKGYRIIEYNGQEVLIYVHDEQQNQILKSSDPCDQYLFCKKHRITFRVN